MNCQIFETVVNDLAREQMMEANARERALAHSGDCKACAHRLALERRLTFGLRALAAEMKSVSASAGVEQHLLQAFVVKPLASTNAGGESEELLGGGCCCRGLDRLRHSRHVVGARGTVSAFD